MSGERIWRAGIYARLSVDGGEGKRDSIENQLQMGMAFIKEQPSMELVRCYQDLGKSGRTFGRMGFQELLEDGRAGVINCLVVKDLSRLGRNYLEMGIYVEKVFPALGLRLISLTDGYDSLSSQEEENTGLKNMVNDLYAQDISRRVALSKGLKKHMGSYVGGKAPYGLAVAEEGGRRLLVPDEHTRAIVEALFTGFGEGKSLRALARELGQHRVQPPREYERTGQVYREDGEEGKSWGAGTIREILKNPVYGETLLGGEMIVSPALLAWCQKRLEEQKKYGRRDGEEPLEKDGFEGLLFCGLCGRRLGRHTKRAKGSKKRYVRYVCPGMECRGTGIPLTALKAATAQAFSREPFPEAFAAGELKGIYGKSRETQRRELERRLKNLEKQEERRKKALAFSYMAYCKGTLSREALLEEQKRREGEEERLKRERKEAKKSLMEEEEREKEVGKSLEELAGGWVIRGFDCILPGCLVKRIVVYPERRLELLWNFRRSAL